MQTKTENNSDGILLSQNIKYLREGLELSQEDFAQIIGVKRDNITSYERGTIPKLGALLKLVKYFQISLEEVSEFNLEEIIFFDRGTTGIPEPRRKKVIIPGNDIEDAHLNDTPNSTPNSKRIELGVQNTATEESVTQNELPETGHSEKIERWRAMGIDRAHSVKFYYPSMEDVPVMDLAAAANPTMGFLASDNVQAVEHLHLPSYMLKGGKRHYAFPVSNDSMYPTLYINDLLIVSESDTESAKDNLVYVIVSRTNGIMVKRIKNRLAKHGIIRCKSDNRFYDSFNLREDDIASIYEARFKISFNLSDEAAHTLELIHNLEERIEDLEMQKDAK